LRAERDAHWARAREMFAHVPGFPTVKTLDDFDFSFATGVPQADPRARRLGLHRKATAEPAPRGTDFGGCRSADQGEPYAETEHQFRIEIRCHE